MTDEVDVPDELKDIGPDRIKLWRKAGVAAVEAELTHGGTGLGLRSGSDEVQQMAWRWIAWERAQDKDVATIKATPFGIGGEVKIKRGHVRKMLQRVREIWPNGK
jgi:hypothetical protein